MSSAPTPDASLQAEGVAAFRRGDMAAARAAFEAMAQRPWLMLAQICSRMGDLDGEEAALHGQLGLDARHVPALLAMGDLKIRRSDDRAANSFFSAALAQAAVTPQPPALTPLLQRAQQWLGESGQRFERHLLDALADAGMLSEQGSPRIRHAIDLLTGKAEIYLQQPNMFYFPGLPQRAFYERTEFDWVPAFEAETERLRGELDVMMAERQIFRPYVEHHKDRPAPNNPLLGKDEWGACYLWRSGAPNADVAPHCPATMAALALPPMPHVAGQSPVALWSRLQPGAHILPHHGLLNTRLICHLPLIVPGNGALRVGAFTREWEVGRLLIFDDSIEHEAWNRSAQDRIVLLFSIWRPEIGTDEREALIRLFETIERFTPAGANRLD